jgi:uncharacterized protein (DUF433 family)
MNEKTTTPKIVVRTGRGLTIAGTRITLYTIMDHLKDEWPPHLIQDWFNLTDKQIEGVLAYIEAHQDEVEAEYQQVLKEAEETEQYWREYNREHFAKVAAMPPKPGQEKIRAKLKARRAKWAQSQ